MRHAVHVAVKLSEEYICSLGLKQLDIMLDRCQKTPFKGFKRASHAR
jgi:hypothetical protein